MYRLMFILFAISYTHSYPTSSEIEESDNDDVYDKLSVRKGKDHHHSESDLSSEHAVLDEMKNLAQNGKEHVADFIEMLGNKLLKYVKAMKEESDAKTYRRSKVDDIIKPEIVYFKSKRPSVMLNVETKRVVDMLANALKSHALQSAVNRVSRRTAEVYNDLKEKKLL